MKTSIKTTISIIAIALSSISIVEAGQNRHDRDHDRNYEKPRQERSYRQNNHRRQWAYTNHRHDRYRGHRHYRKHHNYGHHGKRYIKVCNRSHRKHSGWRRGHHYSERHVYRDTYVQPRHLSTRVFINADLHPGNALPVLAGGLIGSSIANDVSHGDPAATFGGAVFGALVGNALTRH